MLENYLPILVFLIIGIAFGILPVLAGALLGPRKPSDEKYSQFECGFSSFENSKMRFDIRYYLVAILFILFDLEVTFVFPWAVVYSQLGWFGFGAMTLFLFLLVVGFVYEWKKGALEWE
jgi:NADH-quinone oxidoreductase subunit A